MIHRWIMTLRRRELASGVTQHFMIDA